MESLWEMSFFYTLPTFRSHGIVGNLALELRRDFCPNREMAAAPCSVLASCVTSIAGVGEGIASLQNASKVDFKIEVEVVTNSERVIQLFVFGEDPVWYTQRPLEKTASGKWTGTIRER